MEDEDLEELKSQDELKKEVGAADDDDGYEVVEEGEEAAVEEAADAKPPATQRTPEQTRLAELEAEIAELKAKSTQGDSDRNRELNERLDKLDKDKEADVLARFNARRDQVKKELRAAKEAGDTDKEMELTDLLTKMNAAEIVANSQRRERPDPAQSRRPQPTQQREPPTNEARDWYMRNRGWFGTQANAKATAYAKTVDQALFLEGFDKNTPAYFDELDKRVGRVYPTLITPRQGAATVKRQTGSATAPTARGASPRKGDITTADGRLKLTPKRHQVASMLGILDDPAKMKAYKQELRASNARAAAGGTR